MQQYNILILCLGVTDVLLLAVSILAVRRVRQERETAQQKVTETKTEFLARVSNDIKTPMNVIVGMTALGMEETDDPERMAECLGKIDSASRFMMGLLNDLVDMSKIETGRFHLHPRSYAFGDFMESIRDMMEPACAEKGVRFEMTKEDLNLNLLVDPMRFEQLFFNLLNNAVKFTLPGGTVSFRVCNYATYNNCFSADYVVQDSGIGMSAEFQKLLFEPFTQESRAVAEQRNGAGLGLAIVRNIVELMHGTIAVRSEIGVGTEIKVHLEIELAQIQPEKANEWMSSEATRAILSGKRILVVEDHPLNIEIAKRILERQQMEVVCVEDGNAAVKLFEEHEPHYFDAVLMDLHLPELDGWEASRRIRRTARSDAQMIPIIAMSVSSSHEDMDACKEAGMNAYIAKPVEPHRLYRMLCEYLDNPV